MRRFALVLFIFAIVWAGCSGGSPTAPNNNLPVNPGCENFNGSSHVLWGLWHIVIDPVAMAADITPLRSANFTANVTRFMQPPVSPVNMVSFTVLVGSDPTSGHFIVNVNLKHPFPGLNQYNGFDVRGILLTEGSITGMHDPDVFMAGDGDTLLLNPDGYTRWWNYPEFTNYNSLFGFTHGKLAPPTHPACTVNPYKYFADGLESDADLTSMDMSTRGFFPTLPGLETRKYDIQFKIDGGKTVFDFNYAVDASWADPDKDFAPDFPQEAFSLSANCDEAFALTVSDAGSDAYFIDPDTNGGELKLDIEIYDWQAQVNSLGVPGEISAIWLEGSVLGGAVDALPMATVLPGSTYVSSIYEVTLGSLNLTKSGDENILCTIESSAPDSYQPQIPGGDVFSFPDAPLAAYFKFDVSISDESPSVQPTVLTIDPDWGYLNKTLTGVHVTGLDFEPSCTIDLEYAPGDSLAVSNFTWVDSENLTFDLDLTDATLGFYDVIVTNPLALPGILADGFEVKEFKAMWPLTQGNAGHTGYIGLNGPTGNLNLPSWNVTYTGCTLGNALPVFLNETTAFFTIAYNSLETNHLPAVAVNLSDHSIKWQKVINTTSHSSLVVAGLSADGTVVLAYDWPGSYSYGLDADDGSVKWQINAVIGSDSYATHDLDGNFIIASGNNVLSVDPNTGTINWTATVGSLGYCTPAVGTDGTIYVYGNWLTNAQLYALNPSDGSFKWGSPSPGMNRCDNGIVFNPVTENILIISQGGLYAWKDNGSSCSQAWHVSMTYPWYCSTSVAKNGDIYMIDGGGVLRRIDPTNGSTIQSSTGWSTGYGSRPAIGENGLIYINNETYFRAFNPDCSPKWQYFGNWDSYWSGPAIGLDGTVYSVRRTNGLCAWHD